MQGDKASILSTLHYLLWYPTLPFALLAAHPASMRDYRERMGHGDFPDTADAPRIWVHVASVGEIRSDSAGCQRSARTLSGCRYGNHRDDGGGTRHGQASNPGGDGLDACAVGQSARGAIHSSSVCSPTWWLSPRLKSGRTTSSNPRGWARRSPWSTAGCRSDLCVVTCSHVACSRMRWARARSAKRSSI